MNYIAYWIIKSTIKWKYTFQSNEDKKGIYLMQYFDD